MYEDFASLADGERRRERVEISRERRAEKIGHLVLCAFARIVISPPFLFASAKQTTLNVRFTGPDNGILTCFYCAEVLLHKSRS